MVVALDVDVKNVSAEEIEGGETVPSSTFDSEIVLEAEVQTDADFAPEKTVTEKAAPEDPVAEEIPVWWENLDVDVPELARYDNWDHRECAVSNAEQWKDAVRDYLETAPEIPKVMHQIWVGPKEPPCIWLDTWRVDYRHDYPSWDYKLWTDEEVAKLDMINRDLYDGERMWQCKADILRLEILYKLGGVYIDADMVSLRKNIDEVISTAEGTKFLIMYEPDTKDKPYSVIGNSFIATTPKHPIVKMLIDYIKKIYHHKRPYHGVEWVTGPLAFTKCLAHTDMPMTVPPTSYFYPQFHFVPNPDAINLESFPDSYAFQFGYTCSGLEGWVQNNNRCKQALYCGVHKNRTQWPMGTLKAFPAADELKETSSVTKSIPKVIHQFSFQPVGSKPERWMRTWYEDFVAENGSEWSYKVWTLEDLKSGSYFCANMYHNDRPMDAVALQLLAMEILYEHGGYYVPLSVLYHSQTEGRTTGSFFSGEAAFVERGCIVGSVAKGNKCLDRIKAIYDGENVKASQLLGARDDPPILSMGYADSISAYCYFPEWSRYLGASAIYDYTRSPQAEQMLLVWGYDSNVPCYRLTKENNEQVNKETARCIVVTDPEVTRFRSTVDAIPSMLKSVEDMDSSWDVLLIGLEWEAGENAFDLYRSTMPFAPPSGKFFAAVFNDGRSKLISNDLDTLCKDLLERCHDIKLYVGVEKFEHNRDLSEIFSSIPAVQNAFSNLAGHQAPLEFDNYETHGTLLKGFKNGNLALEINADRERRIMYRAWNDDGGLNCEMKMQSSLSGDVVEWMRVYFAHQVVFDANNKRVGG